MKHSSEPKTVSPAIRRIPNCITCLRIVGTVILAFLPPMGMAFYVTYALCGLSDVLDGMLARKLHAASALGATLDSAADLAFYGVFLVRLLPILRRRLPNWIWHWVGLIFLLRVGTYLLAAVRQKEFSHRHTLLNKLTGFLVFGIGLMLASAWLLHYSAATCTVALISAGEELTVRLLMPAKE